MSTRIKCAYIYKRGKAKDKNCTIYALENNKYCKRHAHLDDENPTSNVNAADDNISVASGTVNFDKLDKLDKMDNKGIPPQKFPENLTDQLIAKDYDEHLINSLNNEEIIDADDEEKKKEARKKDLQFMVQKSREEAAADSSKKKSETPPSIEIGKTDANRPLVTNGSMIKTGAFVVSSFIESICVNMRIPLDGLSNDLMKNDEFIAALKEVVEEYSPYFSYEATPKMKLCIAIGMIACSTFMRNYNDPNYKKNKEAAAAAKKSATAGDFQNVSASSNDPNIKAIASSIGNDLSEQIRKANLMEKVETSKFSSIF